MSMVKIVSMFSKKYRDVYRSKMLEDELFNYARHNLAVVNIYIKVF